MLFPCYFTMIFGVRLLKPHSFLPGRMPEAAKPQFAMGPQKCVVMGPVGELINAASAKRPKGWVLAKKKRHVATGWNGRNDTTWRYDEIYWEILRYELDMNVYIWLYIYIWFILIYEFPWKWDQPQTIDDYHIIHFQDFSAGPCTNAMLQTSWHGDETSSATRAASEPQNAAMKNGISRWFSVYKSNLTKGGKKMMKHDGRTLKTWMKGKASSWIWHRVSGCCVEH